MPTELADLLAFGLTGSTWWVVLLYGLIATQLTILSVTLFLHRGAAHRAVDFHPAVEHVFRFWTWLTTAMVTKEWVAIHRKHHAKCETADDPHSPVHFGINRVFWHGVELYQEARADRGMVEQYGLGTVDDALERNVYGRFPSLGPTLLALSLIAAFGAVGLTVWAIQMLWIPFWAAGVVNGLGHWWGYRNFETADRSTNLIPWAFWIGGEELHNNHHAFPSSARFSMRPWEFDIGWAVLRGLEKLGLARVLREAPRLAVREVESADAETLRALLAHRAAVMTAYFRSVIKPALADEAQQARDAAQRLGRRLRKALANDGRWLEPAQRERLALWVRERPSMALVVEYRRRLVAVMERSGKRSEDMLHALQAWCADAEASGIASLEEFARRLRGYALAPARG
ncbi:MAG: fatty acid desaturase [Pseudomonadota bacterium]|jgi:stearoyl-CoA desaturase (delta-9 desaturase)